VLLADCIRATVRLVDNAGGEELLEVVEQLPGGGFVEPNAELGGCRRGMNEGLDELNALSMIEGGEQTMAITTASGVVNVVVSSAR
jgi:hypothetical protein